MHEPTRAAGCEPRDVRRRTDVAVEKHFPAGRIVTPLKVFARALNELLRDPERAHKADQ